MRQPRSGARSELAALRDAVNRLHELKHLAVVLRLIPHLDAGRVGSIWCDRPADDLWYTRKSIGFRRTARRGMVCSGC